MVKKYDYTATIGTEKVNIQTSQKITHGDIVSVYGVNYVAANVILNSIKLKTFRSIAAIVIPNTKEKN